MVWTDPKTWGAGEDLTSIEMNTYLKDNQLYLADKPMDFYVIDGVVNYAYSGTSFAAVDVSSMSLDVSLSDITYLDINLYCTLKFVNGAEKVAFDIKVNGAFIGGNQSGLLIVEGKAINEYHNVALRHIEPVVATGAFNVELWWRTFGGTNVDMLRGNGSTGADDDVLGQFMVKAL